jgi:hypothetical protein
MHPSTSSRSSRSSRQRQADAFAEPNGGIVAAVVAAGAGCAVLGLCTVASAASGLVAQLLTFYAPTGPLSGKSLLSSLLYLIIWGNLHFRLRDRELRLARASMLTMVLLAIGFAGTFPPVYQLFGHNG